MVIIVLVLLVVVAFGYPIVFRLLANIDNAFGKVMSVLWNAMVKCYELGEHIPFMGFLFSICVAYMRFVDRTFGK